VREGKQEARDARNERDGTGGTRREAKRWKHKARDGRWEMGGMKERQEAEGKTWQAELEGTRREARQDMGDRR
jgi:hypothetical protein